MLTKQRHSERTRTEKPIKLAGRTVRQKRDMTSRRIDRDIISEIKQGNKERFREIERRYHEKLYFYLRHLIGYQEETEDVLQNVFIKAYEHLDSFDNRRAFSSWIYRIAHNEAINWIKKKNRRKTISWEDVISAKDQLKVVSDEESPQDTWIRKELRQEVREAMGELPAKYKEVLLLRFFFDRSYNEISEIIDRPRNTVGTLISRAKGQLIRILNANPR